MAIMNRLSVLLLSIVCQPDITLRSWEKNEIFSCVFDMVPPELGAFFPIQPYDTQSEHGMSFYHMKLIVTHLAIIQAVYSCRKCSYQVQYHSRCKWI